MQNRTFEAVLGDLNKALRVFVRDVHELNLKEKIAATQPTEPGFSPPLPVAPAKIQEVAAQQIEQAIHAKAWVSAKPVQVERPESPKITGSRFGLWNTAPVIGAHRKSGASGPKMGAHRDADKISSQDAQDTTPKKRGP
jgi:hypothetical protein